MTLVFYAREPKSHKNWFSISSPKPENPKNSEFRKIRKLRFDNTFKSIFWSFCVHFWLILSRSHHLQFHTIILSGGLLIPPDMQHNPWTNSVVGLFQFSRSVICHELIIFINRSNYRFFFVLFMTCQRLNHQEFCSNNGFALKSSLLPFLPQRNQSDGWAITDQDQDGKNFKRHLIKQPS